MTEKAPKISVDTCGLEGFKGRPLDCKNNFNKYPENHRPKVCFHCLINPEFSKVAASELPSIYIDFKQGKVKLQKIN